MRRSPRVLSVIGTVLGLLSLALLPAPAAATEHVGAPTGLDRVDFAVTPTGDGAWALSADGAIVTFGDARLHGQAQKGPGDAGRFVGIAAHASGEGYWVTDEFGKVWAFGQADLHGELDFVPNEPVVGIAAHPSGDGYWLAANDGGVFAFGAADFLGGMGHVALNRPVVGITAAKGHDGYWLVASDGGVFTFGDQSFHGSTGDIPLNEPITDITSTITGDGYWMLGADGGVFSFGDATFMGSIYTRDDPRASEDPFIAMETAWTQDGYFMLDRSGAILGFGDANLGPAPPEGADPIGELRTDPRRSPGFPALGDIALLTDVRTAPHPGFERVVFDFESGDLEYHVRWVDRAPVDTAGNRVEVAGDAMLHVSISGATGVDLTGPVPVETYEGPDRFSPDRLHQVQELALVSDFEAHLEWVVGTRQRAGFAVAVLSDPARLVIDIATTGTGVNLSVDPQCVTLGGEFTVRATGLEPGEEYTFLIDPVPDPAESGARVRADARGVAELSGTMPQGAEPDDYVWSISRVGQDQPLASAEFMVAEVCIADS